jgi:hypothetical protein
MAAIFSLFTCALHCCSHSLIKLGDEYLENEVRRLFDLPESPFWFSKTVSIITVSAGTRSPCMVNKKT